MKMGGRQGPRGGRRRDRGALGACGTSLGFRVAGGRGRWSSPARRSPWDVEHKARGVLQATGFPYCSGRGLGLRSPTPDGKNGGLVPPVAKGERPGGKGPRSGPRLGRESAHCVCSRPGICRVASLHPRWGQCARHRVRLRHGWTVTPYPGVPLARANGPSGSERSRPGRPSRCFEGQKENALQSRP